MSFSPYITVSDADAAITFYKRVFGATERLRLVDPTDGRVGHAEIAIGDALVMISDEYPDFGALGPVSIGGTPVKLHVYVPDVDAVFTAAIAAGATELRPVSDQFFGDRVGSFADPFGHVWMIATHQRDVSPEEMQRLWNEAMA